MNRLSISGNYVFDNAADGEDFWSISAHYNLGDNSTVRFGGGKHGTLFANYIYHRSR